MKCSPEPDAAQNPKNKTWQPYTHLLGQGNRPSPLATVTHPTWLALTRQAILLYLHAQILVVCLNEMPRRPSDETVKPIGSPGGARTAYTSLFTQKMMQETGGRFDQSRYARNLAKNTDDVI